MTEIQRQLNAARTAGWTDRALAIRLEVTPMTVWRWREGRATPPSPGMVARELESVLREPVPPRERPGPHTTVAIPEME